MYIIYVIGLGVLLYITSTMIKQTKNTIICLYILGATLDSTIAQGKKIFILKITKPRWSNSMNRWMCNPTVLKVTVMI